MITKAMRKSIYQEITKKEAAKWESEKRKEWKKNAGFWIKIIRENLDPYRLKVTNPAILKILKGRKELKILDVGCGEGYLCRMLVKNENYLFGLDFSPTLIESAKEKEKKNPLGIQYFVGDFRKTNFSSSFFDIVISHQSIFEVPNPKVAFREFARILKRNGELILLFLHPCFDTDPLDYFKKLKIKKDYYLVSGIRSSYPYFYLHLPLSEWIKILIEAGFSIKNIEEPHPSFQLLKNNKWWQKNFKKPLFILIQASKK